MSQVPVCCYHFLLTYSQEDSDQSEDESFNQYDAVTCTGLQPGTDVYVFGPDFQVSSDGSVIPTNQQGFVWVEEILHKLQRPVNPLSPPAATDLNFDFRYIVNGMLKVAGDTIFSGMYLLGKFVLL